MDDANHLRACSISTASRSRSTASRRSTNCRFIVEPGEMRAIIGPNGAGKTTMMDVITGKTRPDVRRRLVPGRRLRSVHARRDRDRRARHRPQIPEADRVRHAHGRGQSAAGAQERPARARDAAVAVVAAAGNSRIDKILDIIRLKRCALARSPAACRTARSSGSKSACCWRRNRSCCWSTSRSPA